MDNRLRLSLVLTYLAAFALLSPACSYQGAFVPISCDSSDECPEGAICTNGHCQIDELYIDGDAWAGEPDIDEPDSREPLPDAADGPGQDSGPGEQDIQEPLECEQGMEACGDQCVDLDNNGEHCGQCGRNCSDISSFATGQCIGRVCQVDCGEELTSCGELCVDLTDNEDYCGDCATSCNIGEFCLQSQCRPTCNLTGAPFGAGDGSPDDPYLICSPTHLQNISSALDKHFILAESIDLSTLGEDFEPIALSKGASFTGTFDGSNLEIRNLTIDNTDSYRSLFGYIGDDGVVKDLILKQGEVIGGERTAALAGVNKGTIDNCHALELDIRGAKSTGGLVGENEGQILNSSVAVTVEGSGENVGGLLGRNYGTVNNSSARGTVTGSKRRLGGLVGQNEGGAKISNSFAEVALTGSDEYTGGLVGRSYGSIESSHFSGSISGTKSNMGGLVGYAEGSSCHISKSSASGEIFTDDSNSIRIGGLVGTLNKKCQLEESFAAMSITAERSDHVGGLIGRVDGGSSIQDCYSIGSIEGSKNVGGLAGRLKSGSVKRCYSLSSVRGDANTHALFGARDSGQAVGNTYWNKTISGQDNSGAGGLSWNSSATELSREEFGEPSNFSTWKFGEIWQIFVDDDPDADIPKRPILHWEVP